MELLWALPGPEGAESTLCICFRVEFESMKSAVLLLVLFSLPGSKQQLKEEEAEREAAVQTRVHVSTHTEGWEHRNESYEHAECV